jgi:PAS domain S-box-containing protein
MPTLRNYPRKRLLLYLIPILIGFAGVLFARQLDHLGLRGVVLLFSVAVPVFAGGNLLARYRTSRFERMLLVLGVLMLMAGAALTVSGITDDLLQESRVSETVAALSRTIGILSLLLGLFAVLFAVVSTGEDIEEVGERFWHLAEHISEGFILSTAQGMITMVNRQFLDMSDLREEEVLGHDVNELAERLRLGAVSEHLENRRRGIASEYELDWKVRGENRRFWFKGTPIFDRHGRHTATLATVRDITEHYRLSQRVERYAEGLQQLVEEQTKKLLRSEKRFRQLLLSMNEGFLTIDAAHRIRFANERIAELLKLPPDQLPGRDVFDFVDAQGRVRLLSLLARGEALDRTQMRQEMNFVTAGGAITPTMLAVAHLPDRPQSAVYSLVVTSVADLKAMQHELEAHTKELERANEELLLHGQAKDRFLSNVSHELRTPLSTIQGYVEMLESGSLGALEAPQLGAVKVMRRNVKRLVGHINEMIEFSRMEIRGIQLNVGLFSAARLVEESVASIHPQAVAKDITVNFFCPDNLPSAWGDADKLAQVLGVLLNNALKFTDERGMIRVQVAVEEERGLAITVMDTGIGIEPLFHAKVFEKFFQVDSSMTRRYEGTGIGLSIAKSIVEAHQGEVTLDSTPGKGSTFKVLLPHALFDSRVASERLEGLEGLKMLLVDTGKEFFKVVRRTLEGCPGEFVRAANGYECVRLAKEHEPDVILLNESATDLAGQNSLTLLRQHPSTMTIPVVVCSSESPARLRELAHLWSSTAFLHNPFDAQRLVEQIRLLCLGEFTRESLPVGGEATDPAEARPHVLVIDPDPGLIEWVEMALQHRRVVCCGTFTVQQALETVQKDRPDVIFLNADMPPAELAEEVAALRQVDSILGIPIYLMTGWGEHPGILGDVNGSLRKPFTINEMMELIQGNVSIPDAAPQMAAG